MLFLRRTLSWGWGLAAALLILLALVVSISRLLFPFADRFRPEMEAMLTEALQRPVEIGRLQAEWTGFYPLLRVHQLSMPALPEQSRAFSFEELRISLNPLLFLPYTDWQPSGVAIVGARLEIARRADGSIGLVGVERMPLPTGSSATDASLVHKLARLGRISLVDADITWIDRLLDQPGLQFSKVNLSARLRDGSLQLAGTARLPEALGTALEFIVHLRGDLAAPQGWEGRFYVKAEDIRAPAWLPVAGFQDSGIQQGLLQAELWGDWQRARLHAMQGSVDVRDLRFALANDALYVFDRIGAQLRWVYDNQGWRLDAEQLMLQRAGRSWPQTSFNLAGQRTATGALKIKGAFDYIELRDVSEVLLTGDTLQGRAREVLNELHPRGELHGLRVDAELADGVVGSYALNGSFTDLGIQAWKRVPAMQGMDGSLRFSEAGGELQLKTEQASVDFTGLFREPLSIDSLEAGVHWQRGDQAWVIKAEDIAVRNADLNAKGQISLDVPHDGGTPVLDLDVRFADGVVAHTGRYLPVGIMPKATVEWLDSALVSGRVTGGRAQVQGPVNQFPYAKGGGRFETRFEVADVVLRYQKNWPEIQGLDAEVVFAGSGMHINARSGQLYATRLQPTTATIADLKQAVLQVDGSTRGPSGDIVEFLRQSPLGSAYAPTLAVVQADGEAPLRLALTLDLQRGGKPPQVNGEVQLDGSQLALADWGIRFEQLQGVLNFNQDGLQADAIQARLFGQPAKLGVVRDKRGNTLQLEGRADTTVLARNWPHAAWKKITGTADITASLLVPPAKSAGTPVLRVGSSLAGVKIDLPSVLAKQAGTVRAVSAELRPFADDHLQLALRYGGVLDGVFDFAGKDKAYTFSRGELRIGGVSAQLPEQAGLRLAGVMETFVVEDWQGFSEDRADARHTDPMGLPPLVTSLDFTFDTFQSGTHVLRGVQLLGTRIDQGWQLKLASDEAAGRVVIPATDAADRTLILDLDRLRLGGDGKQRQAAGETMTDSERQQALDALAAAEAKLPRIDPRQLPPLKVNVRKFSYQGGDFGGLELESVPAADGMHIERFSLTDDALQVNASGDWHLVNGRHNSNFNLDIRGPKLGPILAKFGYTGGIQDGKTHASLLATWPDAPAFFGLHKLDGRMHVDIKDGSFTDIEPGAGRVFGLFNLDEVQRRLRLDFTDLFGKGFSFDSISGDISFSNGDAYTNNMTVTGPPAKLEISGRTGLASRDYDQTITITPSVGGSLPVAGAIAHPGIGAALFVAQKLFQSQIESMTRYQYTVRGSWEKPQIERVDRPLLDRLEAPVKDLLKK